MLQQIDHALLIRLLSAPVGALIALAIAAAALRTRTGSTTQPDEYPAGHRGRGRAWLSWRHQPRHVVAYTPRHEQATTGPVQLGQTLDGDITLIHADPVASAPAPRATSIGDEPTNPSLEALLRRREPIGAAA